MIITRNWIQEFIDISQITTEDICKTLNSIGLEVDSVNKVRIVPNVIIGKVISKEKHPDADKLNICQVDVGTSTVQIVCGAKNVDKDQYVPVAMVGCDLGNNFKIKKAKLRGVESNGMICSTTEIGLVKLNDGILELDSSIGKLVLGRELNEYKLLNDDIIEIELTANRGDCLSIHGVARDLSAFYNIKFKEFDKKLNYTNIGIGKILEVECEHHLDSSLIFKAVDVQEFKLPIIQKLRVATIDKYEANDIKDILTYVTHTKGVILNAYGKNQTDTHNELCLLHVKKDKDGFDNVYGKKQLSKICIEHNKLDTTDDTFIIEASYINPELLSQNVFDKKIKTGDIYYKSSRGSEPDVKTGIDYFTTLISKFGALIYNGSETFTEDKQKTALDVSVKKISSIIGQKIPKAKVEVILSSLGFDVKEGANEVFNTLIPFFRHDIKNIADVTEEIVRIIGIDNIKSKPLSIDEVNRVNKTSKKLVKKNSLRLKAVSIGFYETLTYIFTNRDNLLKYNFDVVNDKLDILNPIVQELNTFRTSLLPNLIDAVSNNTKMGFKTIPLFEIGTVFNAKREESTKVGFVFSGLSEVESFLNGAKPENINFFTFSSKILNCIGKFDIKPMEKITNDFIHPYQNGDIFIDNKKVGFIAKLHPSVATDFDIAETFVAEINFDSIKDELVKTVKYSNFQASKKDLSLIVPKTMQFLQIKKVIDSINDETIKQYNLIDIYTDDKLGENESITIRFVLQNSEKTMEEDDITSTMDSIVKALYEELGITLR